MAHYNGNTRDQGISTRHILIEASTVNWLSRSWPWWLSGGLVLVQFLPEQSALGWLLLAFGLGTMFIFARWTRVWVIAASLLVIGAGWGGFWGMHTLDKALPSELIKQDVWVTGTVQDLPQVKDHAVRFRFNIKSTLDLPPSVRFSGDILLNWYDKPFPDLKIGQQWALKIRMKPSHGLMNPGGFNYEQWLFSQGIRATGYVRNAKQASLVDQAQSKFGFGQLRTDIKHFIEQMDISMGGILKALTIGERSDIRERQWQVFRRTGTAHLIAISGLHIGLIAGVVYALMHYFWRHSFLCVTLLPAPHPARLAALFAAGIYAALAGFSVPTVRALSMLVAYFALSYLRRNPGTLFTLGFVLMCVLIADPLAPLGAGVWLSFGAVAAIAYAVGKREKVEQPIFQADRRQAIARKTWRYLSLWMRVQWAVFLVLMPLQLVFFGQFSLISLIANFIAIPLFGMIIVPIALLSALFMSIGFSSFAERLLVLANDVIELIWPTMEFLSDMPLAAWQAPAPSIWVMMLAIVGAIILLTRDIGKKRFGAVLGFLPLLMPTTKSISPGAFDVQILDVGQGLAVVVHTAQHTLLYDAGIKYPSGFDMGRAIVIPYMRQRGIKQLDSAVASHQNIDHYGGLDAVLDAYPAKRRYSSAAFYKHSQPCEDGVSWVWDEVEFSFLHPNSGNKGSENNDSCVLSIQSRFGTALLTGDIEHEAERELLALASELIRSDVLLVPHHGSRTSSGEDFIDQVNPQLAVISAAYLNRFKHPHAEVMRRFEQRGISVLNTASAGGISIVFDESGIQAKSWREMQKRYWMRLFEFFSPVSFTPRSLDAEKKSVRNRN